MGVSVVTAKRRDKIDSPVLVNDSNVVERLSAVLAAQQVGATIPPVPKFSSASVVFQLF